MASITIEDIITFLLETPMFGDLDATGLSQIVHIMQVQRVRDGHAIFREGDPGDAWYVLYQGAADVLKESDFLPSRTIATIGPRACFGEMALLDHSPRSATVVSRGETTVFRFPRKDFEALLAEGNLAAYKLVYEKYLEARGKCGQSTDLSFEAVREALRKQVRQIKSTYNVDSVKFRIVVEEGRAKVKAVPQGAAAPAGGAG